MAEFDTLHRTQAGARSAVIDAGLRAYMNKVYGLMSVAMLITGAVAWVLANMAMTTDPAQAVGQIGAGKYLTQFGALIYTSPLKWVLMFAPLLVVFGFGAMINRLSAASVCESVVGSPASRSRSSRGSEFSRPARWSVSCWTMRAAQPVTISSSAPPRSSLPVSRTERHRGVAAWYPATLRQPS